MSWIIFLISIGFALLLPRGTNVPHESRPVIVKWLVIINLAIHIVTQIFEWQSGTPYTRYREELTSPRAKSAAEQLEQFKNTPLAQYWDVVALTPEKLEDESWRWIQILTANFIHGDWEHVIFNLWIFAVLAVNLEDFFGKRKFLLFILTSCIASYLAVALFSRGTEAFEKPHLGFSGVVYATLCAYLICFPRSRVNVILIYDIRFWAFVVITVTVISFMLAIVVGSFAQLIWVLAFIGLFIAFKPEHASFGVPVLVFVGYQLVRDALHFEEMLSGGRTSIWAHGGGFMCGAVWGLLMNGMKGFERSYDEEKLPEKLTPTERVRKEAEKLAKESDTSEAAARQLLAQRVFVGDAPAATDFYINTVMPKYPNIVLDPREHLTLARMLEFRGHLRPAFHAYRMLLWNEPDTPGVEGAYLQAATITREMPDLIPDALPYLNKFDMIDYLMMRDRVECRRLKAELIEIAEKNGMDVSETKNQMFFGDPAKARPREEPVEPKNVWGQKVEARENVPISPKASRMKRLETLKPVAEPKPVALPAELVVRAAEQTSREAAKKRSEEKRSRVEPVKLFFSRTKPRKKKRRKPQSLILCPLQM